MFSSGFVDIVVPRVVSSPSDKAASIVDQRFNSYKTSERILHKPFTSPEGSDEDTWWHAEKVITVSLFRVMLFNTHSQSENHSVQKEALPALSFYLTQRLSFHITPLPSPKFISAAPSARHHRNPKAPVAVHIIEGLFRPKLHRST